MTTETKRNDVAPVDADQVMVFLAAFGLGIIMFAGIAAFKSSGLFNFWPGVLLVVGCLCLVGALIVKGLGSRV